MFSAGLDCLLELGLCEPSDFHPVGADPGPLGGFQALIGLLCPKGFLSRGLPHKSGIAVFGVVVHEYGGYPESRVG